MKADESAGARGTGEPNRTEIVYRGLSEELRMGLFAPGTVFKLREVAARFGTSLTPARDALGRLVAERALATQPNRSVRVAVPTAEQMRELRRIRSELEGFATAVATPRVTPAALARIRDLQAGYVAARLCRDAPAMLQTNRDFHFAIYEMTGMPQLLILIESFWLRNGPMMNLLYRNLPEVARRSDRHHDAIIAALDRGDPIAARAATGADIAEVTEDVASLLETLTKSTAV